jgi:ribosome-binding protein aMBF1 (putative translation factor)
MRLPNGVAMACGVNRSHALACQAPSESKSENLAFKRSTVDRHFGVVGSIRANHIILTRRRVMVTQRVMEVEGQKLRRLRRQRVWWIGDLACESGVHRNVISELENGKGRAYPVIIRKLAKALDVDPTELVAE